MSSIGLLERLEFGSGKKIKLKINDNRTTMLSVKWEPEYTKVSLHRMFLKAPLDIMSSLGSYIRREKKVIDPSVKAYIEHNLNKLDYSKTINKSKLSTQGRVYDLQAIFDGLNENYFDGELDLGITWFGTAKPKTGTRINLGLYQAPLKLIKIHRLLDSTKVPLFVLEYIIYHEMVHFVHPPYVDKNGTTKIHHKAFKAKEESFEQFAQADKWIKKHQHLFFHSTF